MSDVSSNSKYCYIFFDFDGVWTDNFVFTDSTGNEFVRTSKSDSLGLALFREKLESNSVDIKLIILSKETNPTPVRRAEKMNIECFSGIDDKLSFARRFLKKDTRCSLSEIIYLGNDLNDLEIMRAAGFSMCPSDSHPEIKEIANFVGNRRGGEGFVREALMYISDMININRDQFRSK